MHKNKADHHHEEIFEVKADVKAIASNITLILKQLEVISSLRDDVSLLKHENTISKDKIDKAFEAIDVTNKIVYAVDRQTSKWLNRGIGAAFLGSILIGVIQFLVYSKVERYEKTQDNHSETLITLDRRISWAEYEIKKRVNK